MTPHIELAGQVIAEAGAKGLTLATAESCTAGLISAALTDVAGSSAVFDRGFVTYSYPSKTALLDVPAPMLYEHGAVSEPVARQMATGALAHSDADIAVAVTGVAGPGADGAKPEGLVWFGIATHAGTSTLCREFGPLGRENVRQETVKQALLMLLAAIADS